MRFASHSLLSLRPRRALSSDPLQQCDMRELRTLSIYELRLRLQLAEPQLLLFDCNVGGVGAESKKEK